MEPGCWLTDQLPMGSMSRLVLLELPCRSSFKLSRLTSCLLEGGRRMGSLQFGVLHHYEALGSGIVVPAIVAAVKQIRYLANVDTGASFCIFKLEHGEELGLEIEKGIRQGVGTVNGIFMTYGHEAALHTLGFQFSATVYFTHHNNHPPKRARPTGMDSASQARLNRLRSKALCEQIRRLSPKRSAPI